jgi:hypothetical protein
MTSNFVMKSIRLALLGAVTLIPAMACSFSATSVTAGAGGGNVAVQVYTQPGCSWQLTAGASWLQIYSAHTGTGSGTVYVYVAPNRGATRSAYMNVLVYGSGSGANSIPGRSSVGPIIASRSVVTEY